MENVAFITRKKITMDKFSTQIKVSTASPIKKILNVDATSIISSCDVLSGYVSLSGKIKANVIFVNKLDELDQSEVFFDFIEKQQLDIELDDMIAEDRLTLKNVSFSNAEAICVFEHQVVLNGNYSYELPAFSEDNKDFVTKTSTFEAQKFVTSSEDNFVVAEETEVNFTDLKVISSSANLIITDTSCLVDKISIEGKILSNVIYKDSEGVGHLAKEFEFKQEIQSNGTLPNMKVAVIPIMKNVTVTPEENEGKTNLVYAFDLYAKGIVYEEGSYEIIEDMFSLKNKIQTTYDYIDARTFSKMKNFTDTTMLTEDISKLENFDDILSIYLPKFAVSSVEESEDKAIISGVITSRVLYKTENDDCEFETNLPVKLDIIKENDEVVGNVLVSPEISSFKVKAGKFLEVIYNINYMVNFEKEVSEKYVKEYEIQGEKSENEAGIKIYITKQGETLFEVAKSLNVRPETITSQNEVDGSFEQGEKIYIYSPINLYN